MKEKTELTKDKKTTLLPSSQDGISMSYKWEGSVYLLIFFSAT